MNPALSACEVHEFYYFPSWLGTGEKYFRKRNIFRRMLENKTKQNTRGMKYGAEYGELRVLKECGVLE